MISLLCSVIHQCHLVTSVEQLKRGANILTPDGDTFSCSTLVKLQ